MQKNCQKARERRLVVETERQGAAARLLFAHEDSTLGNLLRHALLADRRVTFAAFRLPHYLRPEVEVKVAVDPQTGCTARAAVEDALATLRRQTARLDEALSAAAAAAAAEGLS